MVNFVWDYKYVVGYEERDHFAQKVIFAMLQNSCCIGHKTDQPILLAYK